jgi:hypothetical protein
VPAQVYLSNLPHSAVEEALRAFCETAGDVFQLRVPKDRDTGSNKG